jgi:hypothetical protein
VWREERKISECARETEFKLRAREKEEKKTFYTKLWLHKEKEEETFI